MNIDIHQKDNASHLFCEWTGEKKPMLDKIVRLEMICESGDWVPIRRVWNEDKDDFDLIPVLTDRVADYYDVFHVLHLDTGKLYRWNQRRRINNWSWDHRPAKPEPDFPEPEHEMFSREFTEQPDNHGEQPKGEQSKGAQFKGTREEWFMRAGNWLYQDIIKPESKREDNAKFRVSTGYPKGARGSRKGSIVLGVCYRDDQSSDGHNEIFITPVLDDSVTALSTLLHELIHAEDNCQSGHKGEFKRLALACGLTGKMTETIPTAELSEALEWWIEENGTMPHAAMLDTDQKKQGTRMIKVHCTTGCTEFTARASRKVTDAWQLGNIDCPICSHHLTFED